MLLLLLSCAPEETDVCTTMCEAAESLYGDCLTSWGAGWEAAGYADADAFAESCETWTFEMRQLEVDAGKSGATTNVCEERAAALTVEDAACDAFTGVDWNALPWIEEE